MRALQDSLFDPAGPIDRVTQPRVGHHHRDATETERRAAQAQVALGGKRRLQVLKVIVDAGVAGVTRQEIADLYGIPIQSVCGRVKELLDGQFVVQSGTRERHGRRVLLASQRGRRAVTR